MHLPRTVLITIATSLLLCSSVGPSVAASHSQPATPLNTHQPSLEPTTASLTVANKGPVQLSASENELVGWVRDRFELVGLDLPAVDVSFHDDTDPCKGNHGIYHGDGDRPRVLVCVPDSGTFASDLQRQRTLVHELAHAWEQANLTDAERHSLLETLDAGDWYAPDSNWEERGSERFAETIVWGLYDQVRRLTLIDVPCGELHADFITITGHSAPGPIAGVCSTDLG